MAALIQFVDSISASPTVRLDVNDALSWFCRNFQAPPPRLRRSVSQNAMRDGQHVSSSSYEARELTLELTLIEDADEDYAAQEMQKLWRELDRETNYLMYHPDGLDKPVFFVLHRSDVEDLEELWTSPIARNITIVLPAEPFALGLPETVDAGSNYANASTSEATPLVRGLAATVGDVPSPLLLWSTTDSITDNLLLIAGVGTTNTLESEGLSNLTDTSSVAGDATYSNSAGKSVSFATTTAMVARTSTTLRTLLPGNYQLLGRFKKSVAADVIVPGIGVGSVTRTPTESMAATTEFQVLQFGIVTIDRPIGMKDSVSTEVAVKFLAQRVSGSGSLGIDFLIFVPCSSTAAIASPPSTTNTLVFDAYADDVYPLASGASPLDLAAGRAIAFDGGEFTGALPYIQPNAATHLTVVRLGGCAKSVTTNVAAAYWPRYLYVRPSAS